MGLGTCWDVQTLVGWLRGEGELWRRWRVGPGIDPHVALPVADVAIGADAVRGPGMRWIGDRLKSYSSGQTRVGFSTTFTWPLMIEDKHGVKAQRQCFTSFKLC